MIAAGKLGGRSARSVRSATIPPAEVAMPTTSKAVCGNGVVLIGASLSRLRILAVMHDRVLVYEIVHSYEYIICVRFRTWLYTRKRDTRGHIP
jgi:hypothetical protein